MLARTPLKDQMIAWLEDQDPNDSYDWNINCDCACARFAASIGRFKEWEQRIPHTMAGAEWTELNIIAGGQSTQHRMISAPQPYWTYGTLLERLRNS